jgi:geranylgeranyl pyrophosphate synthase
MTASMKEILTILEKKSTRALDKAKEQLFTPTIKNRKLHQALAYYAKNWDDTLHPGIMAIACEAVGGNDDDVLLMQIPMLLLTAAIDIHDDVLDGSRVKNGKPTVFGKFGEGVALLLGDGLLLKGMTVACKNVEKIPTEHMRAIISTIETAFAEAGDAHTLELGFKGKANLDPKECFDVIKKKSSILEAHTRIGAIVGNGTTNQIKNLGEYGRILGTLITLRDEFIDMFETQEISDRIKNGCLPLPVIYAFKNPVQKDEIMKILSKKELSKKDAEQIVDIVFQSHMVEHLKQEMKTLSEIAVRMVSDLRAKQALYSLLQASLEDI